MLSSIYHMKLAIKITPTSQEPLTEEFTNIVTEEYVRHLKQTWEKSSENSNDFGFFLGDDTAHLNLYHALNSQGATQIDILTNGAKVELVAHAFPKKTTLGARFFDGDLSQFLEHLSPNRLYDGIALSHPNSVVTKENIQKLFDMGAIHPLCVFAVRNTTNINMELRHIFHSHGYTCTELIPDGSQRSYRIYRLVNLDVLLNPQSAYGNLNMEHIEAWLEGTTTIDQPPLPSVVDDDDVLEFNWDTMGSAEREFFQQVDPQQLTPMFRVATGFYNPGTPPSVEGDMIVFWDSEHQEVQLFHDQWLRHVPLDMPRYRTDIFDPTVGVLELENQEDGMRFVNATPIHYLPTNHVYYVTQLRYGDPKDFYSWEVVPHERFTPLLDLSLQPPTAPPAEGTPILYKQLRGESNDFFKAYYRVGLEDKVHEYCTFLSGKDFYFPPPQDLPDSALLGKVPKRNRRRRSADTSTTTRRKRVKK